MSKNTNANPALIDWPTDHHAILSNFKKEALRTIERVHGCPEKEADLIATLKIIAGFAVARIAQQKANRATYGQRIESILAGPKQDAE